MADHLQVTTQIVTSKFTDGQVSKTLQQDQTNALLASDIATINTSASSAINYGSIGAANVGYCYLESLSSSTGTASIIFGVGSTTGLFESIGKLKGGELAVFRINTSKQLYAQAQTASQTLLSKIYGD